MAEPSPVTRFGLLRHGETLWNRDKRIQGLSDTALSRRGEAAARRWGEELRACGWDRILTSDARRARDTAAGMNVSLRVPCSWDPRLREQDWGEWTGRTLAALRGSAPQLLAEQERAGWDFCPPGGENRRRVRERSSAALAEAAALWPGETILVVTHEGVIKCLLYGLCGRGFCPAEPALLRPRSLHWLTNDSRGLRIAEINAVALPW